MRRRQRTTTDVTATSGRGSSLVAHPNAALHPRFTLRWAPRHVAPALSSHGGPQPHFPRRRVSHPTGVPVVIGHRGASGYRPEHTLAVLRAGDRDGRRLHRARPRLHQGRRPRRPARERDRRHDRRRRPPRVRRTGATTKTVDGHAVDRLVHRGLHARRAEDAARQGAAAARCGPPTPGTTAASRSPPSTRSWTWPSRAAGRRGVTIGVYPETKHPTYFDSIGLSLEEPLVEALRRHHLDRPNAPVFVQSFETGEPARARAPWSRSRSCSWWTRAARRTTWSPTGDPRTYRDLVDAGRAGATSRRTPTAIGAHKELVLPRDATARPVAEPWSTPRTQPACSCTRGRCATRTSSWPELPGRHRPGRAAATRWRRRRRSWTPGVDGVFTDQPDIAVEARAEWLDARTPSPHASG